MDQMISQKVSFLARKSIREKSKLFLGKLLKQ